jgi:Transposase IS4
MARKRRSDDIDYQTGSQESTQQSKKPKKTPPEPGPLPQYTPMHIQPLSNWHEVSKLPKHVNPAHAYEIFSLFITEEILETIARHTNENASLRRQESLPQHARPWKDTTPKELLAYIATYIYMGIVRLDNVADYWSTDPDFTVGGIVQRNISRVRWQQLDRYFHISKPQQQKPQQQAKETPFQKIEPLNEHLREKMKEYWNPTTDLAVDEAIQRFIGRAKEISNIPSKPTPEGFKIWCLANAGYILDWLFHAKGTGPVDLDDYWTEDRGFSPTQAVVLDLLLQAGIHNDTCHIVWLDNLFTSVRLLSTLREEGFGAAGTVRTTKLKTELMAEDPEQTQQTQQTRQTRQTREVNRGLDPSLAELKTEFNTQIPWGKLYGCLSADGNVLEFAWKDQNVVLFMTTVSASPPDLVKKRRKRPAKTATNAKTSRAIFGKEQLKELEIPEFIDLYNHFMNGVDRADQLRVYYK